MATTNGANGAADSRPVFFFDIDNCLYSKGSISLLLNELTAAILTGGAECNIHDEMQKLINKFFVKHLDLNTDDAHMLHQKYYKEYGLAIEGLTRHHKIDPLEFNYEVDDALPLDEILKPDPKLRKLLESLDTAKVKPWLLTNAYVSHGKRVIKLLGVEDLFEGITYCDYGQLPLVCKPSQDMYAKAEKEAGAPSTESCYFVGTLLVICRVTSWWLVDLLIRRGGLQHTDHVYCIDDSYLNCKHAQARGWETVHLVESGVPIPRIPASKYVVSSLHELRVLFPDIFKPQEGDTA
ncbi:uncharacterized protein N7482_004059 [Penicillium canariense]|uniref:Pyrimidine 5-nucleotidase n=1 Tax=Penicillium canariense TaxID=189055 RepID=A0A9W9I5X6_9EURO|nr:uncharacterized protein N7482_004059 [Penicillium canariense]KAJ5168465.1 hypothetical protein N7482_004059 [Penicillium canariense]